MKIHLSVALARYDDHRHTRLHQFDELKDILISESDTTMAHPTPYRTGSTSAMDADLGGIGDGKTDKARAELSLLLRCSSIVVGKEPIGAVIDPLHREEALRNLIEPLQEQINEIRSKRDEKDKELSDAQKKRDDLENRKKIIASQLEEFNTTKNSIL